MHRPLARFHVEAALQFHDHLIVGSIGADENGSKSSKSLRSKQKKMDPD
jgi:hypothetical protein